MNTESFRTKNPQFRETILAHLNKQEFMKAIHATLTSIELGRVIAEIPLDKMHQQQIGLVHGGVTATIADIAAGFAGFTLVGPDEHTVTAEIKVSYLRLHEGGIASNRRSAYGGEFVPGPCTHRPSHHGSWSRPKSLPQP